MENAVMKEGAGFAQLDGWRVAYEVCGRGRKAIVFVHGGTSERSVWRAQMEGLQVNRQLVAVDLLGHGQSDKPEIAYTMDLFARSVAAVVDELGIEQAVLVGHSNGVPVVRQFYRLYPARTEALVAVEGPLRQMMPRERAEWMIAALRRPDYEQFMRGLVEQMPAGSLSEEDLARIKAAALATPKHVMMGELEALLDTRIWEEDEIGVPLLIVLSRNQGQWTDHYEAFVRRIAPQVEYHVWADVSHFLTLERPKEFNNLLEAFVARIDTEII